MWTVCDNLSVSVVSLYGCSLNWKSSFSPNLWLRTGRFTHSMLFPCRAHAFPLPCRVAKGLEYIFHIRFTQCGSVWFTLAMPCSDHAVLLKATAEYGHAVPWPWEERHVQSVAWAWHGKCESDTAALCKSNGTHSKPLAARHGNGMLCVNRPWGSQISRHWAHEDSKIVSPTHRPLLVNKMGKTHSRPLVARHGRGTAWEPHAMCESAFININEH